MSNKSLDSMMLDSAESLASSADTLGSIYVAEKLNFLSQERILLTGKKLFKG